MKIIFFCTFILCAELNLASAQELTISSLLDINSMRNNILNEYLLTHNWKIISDKKLSELEEMRAESGMPDMLLMYVVNDSNKKKFNARYADDWIGLFESVFKKREDTLVIYHYKLNNNTGFTDDYPMGIIYKTPINKTSEAVDFIKRKGYFLDHAWEGFLSYKKKDKVDPLYISNHIESNTVKYTIDQCSRYMKIK